ncbi:MAG: hypothetical protein RBR67_04025 [Desulfobacterium sp.]|nr:hypothetical protein [Desulfobacterium sp.]
MEKFQCLSRQLRNKDPDPILWKLASNLYLTMGNHSKSAEALTVYSMLHPPVEGEQTRLAGLYHCIGIPKAGWWGFCPLGVGPIKEHKGKELSQDAVIWVNAQDI